MSTNKILSNDQIKEMILAARGDLAPDLVLKNARIVNVFTKEIESGDVAIKDGYIVGIGEFDGEEEIDIGGRIICPGLIDGHIHIESSMISPSEFLYRHEFGGHYSTVSFFIFLLPSFSLLWGYTHW